MEEMKLFDKEIELNNLKQLLENLKDDYSVAGNFICLPIDYVKTSMNGLLKQVVFKPYWDKMESGQRWQNRLYSKWFTVQEFKDMFVRDGEIKDIYLFYVETHIIGTNWGVHPWETFDFNKLINTTFGELTKDEAIAYVRLRIEEIEDMLGGEIDEIN